MDATDSLNAENDSILAFLSPFLVYPVAAGDTPPYERIAWWKTIFSCVSCTKNLHNSASMHSNRTFDT